MGIFRTLAELTPLTNDVQPEPEPEPDDCCEVPGGDGSTCDGACGPCNDDASCLDVCGVANGDSSTCDDCCGVPNGSGDSCDGACGPCNDDTSCEDDEEEEDSSSSSESPTNVLQPEWGDSSSTGLDDTGLDDGEVEPEPEFNFDNDNAGHQISWLPTTLVVLSMVAL